ncbi:sensor histidine kinase [Thermobifida alba]|uniref:histidine kinase n=1 Tax=Thermobifida alba TaxID=53522 RepID=A0ABY4L8Q7_THEAE|nr:histidine kinase [Thermobifida alba]UPT22838.1 sensor histidine kinase [Thermobifida alba]
MADSGLGAWRERLISVLHLFTSFALSLLYLVPAALLVLMAGSLSSTVAEIMLRLVPVDWELPVLAALTLVSLPVATLLSRLCTHIQKKRVGALFGIVETTVPEPDDAPPLLRGLRYVLGREAWTTVLYSTVAGFTGLLAGGLTVLLVAYGTGGVVGGVLALAITFLSDVSVQNTGLTTVLLCVLAGPPLVVGGLWAAPWLVRLDTGIMRRVLFDSPQVRVRRRLLELSDTRSRMVDAAEAERRRIERDLHDGAQQRLLALTMTLTRARAKFERDPEQARALLEEAQRESRAVMADLREVARGLHPRVLTDHGLDAALPVAAGRCPVPVRLDVDLAERPSPRAEGVAYYVACEALTNVAKHAGATAVTVRAERVPRRRGDLLRLTVTDDGRGGADPDAGTGLHGLSDRVHAVDGELFVHSPPGEGTVLTADIPWEA